MAGERILIVDDDPGVLEVMKDHLTFVGYDVTVAADGATALKVLVTMTPDLILLDLAMPGIDGIEVLRRVTAKLPHIPVVVVTAFNDNKVAARAFEAAAADYVMKPFDLNTVERVVRAQIARSRARLLPADTSKDNGARTQ